MFEEPIYVTKPTLADIEKFSDSLSESWKSGVLTHNGPKVQKLEKEIERELDLKQNTLVAVTNGTIALQLAIRALGLKGEIITTPYSWIATVSAIQWENCTPVFVDIDPDTLNIDPSKIEEKITPNTVGILPVHVFSNPCDVDSLQDISNRYGLPLIYDGAHAFGVKHKNKSIFEYGHISTASFHATKLFNSGEGGACFTLDKQIFERLRKLRFFGHNESRVIDDVGCNGKMTEIHASLGLVNLPHVQDVLDKRRTIYREYKKSLDGHPQIFFQKIDEDSYNFSYMPIILDSEQTLNRVLAYLKEKNVFPRRYFYPSLNLVRPIEKQCRMPISESITRRNLCLPSYHDLQLIQVREIAKYVLEAIENNR